MQSSSKSTAPRAAAFFDLDKTLMAGSSAMQFGRVAYRHGMVRRRELAGWGLEHLLYRMRGATDAKNRELLRAAQEMLTGVPVKELNRLGPELLAGILPRIYPQMLDEVHAHQDAGRATFIVSAAGNEMIEALARVLGMDGGIGTRYEVDGDGKLSGQLEGPFVYGEGKVEAMRRFAAEHGIEVESSYAYSDSASDLPMLKAVGNPVVVNADAQLLAMARREGWRVLRFERLGRRLAIAGATALAAAVGGGGSLLARRRAGGRRRRPLVRARG
jgi:HAD superfamily hydrolase (TIGR01490 family)